MFGTGLHKSIQNVSKKQAKTLVDSTRATTSSPKLVGVKSNENWYWTNAQHTSFMGARSILTKETLLTFPHSTEPSQMYPEASDKHIGAAVVQDSKLLGATCQAQPKSRQYIDQVYQPVKAWNHLCILGNETITIQQTKAMNLLLTLSLANALLVNHSPARVLFLLFNKFF